jgi:hypothetical protein
MTNKIKSLIYLSCFVFASVIYNTTIENNTQNFSNEIEVVETNMITIAYDADMQQND